jgi:UDPglucose 6-dehydrogenase
MDSPYRIAVVGLWHLGEIYSACLAEMGHRVVGISDDVSLISNFKNNVPPLAEPGLAELLAAHQGSGRLEYTTDWNAIRECNALWLTFDTPVNDEDEVDLTPVYEAVAKAAPLLKDGALLLISSQLPAGTSEKIKGMIRTARPELKFGYAYSPENLRLGEAVKGFLEPGRVVVGADSPHALQQAKDILAPLKAEIVAMSAPSAEMAKHGLNAFLAACISFTNDLADASAKVGADVEDVIKALKSDPRVGPKAYLFAGLGFSGGTLGRDLKALMALARERGVKLPVITSIYEKNRVRNDLVLERLGSRWGSVSGRTVAMLGVTYKAGTPTLRRSQALEVEKAVREAGAAFRLFDPLAIPEEVAAMTPSPFFRDPYEAARGADMLLVVTPSKALKELDFVKLAAAMKEKAIFDTANILVDKEPDIRAAGFDYLSIGR